MCRIPSADRYHAHVLRTPVEVRNAIRYVLGNFASHAARRGERAPAGWVDPFSSAAGNAPREAQGSLFVEPAVVEARTWLLRRAGEGRGRGDAGAPRGPRLVRSLLVRRDAGEHGIRARWTQITQVEERVGHADDQREAAGRLSRGSSGSGRGQRGGR
jgi:hypothetical protein